jgi:hypothetical protein
MRNRRADSEGRFNIRFRHGMPADALTPDGVMRALETYLEFSGIAAAAPAQVPAPTPTATKGTSAPNPASADAANGARGLDALRKELSVNEVDHIPGPAATAVEVQEGLLLITKRTYSMDGMRIAASFVSGVMVDLSITPQ